MDGQTVCLYELEAAQVLSAGAVADRPWCALQSLLPESKHSLGGSQQGGREGQGQLQAGWTESPHTDRDFLLAMEAVCLSQLSPAPKHSPPEAHKLKHILQLLLKSTGWLGQRALSSHRKS